MPAWVQAPVSFIRTRRLSSRRLSRAQFEQRQHKALQHWLRHCLPKVTAFAFAPSQLEDLPVMDKAQLMDNFAAYNIHGITADQVRAAMEEDCRIGSLTVGASTGTSGNRGLFVISDAERYRWLGTIVAKTMADMLWQRQRVAIILPQATRLYESANSVRQIALRFFDLKLGPADWRQPLEEFDPTVIVAPPKVLRHLVEQGFKLAPARVFSAAETLDDIDRRVIEQGFDQPLEEIYMATEGLLGVTCRHGRLHLAEDSVFFEFEPYGDGLVSPLITSFRRETQILARYRMNDLLRLDPSPCPCGSPLQAVSEVVGRMDDCFHISGPNGIQMVTPDILRNAVLMADQRIHDFRLVQNSVSDIALTLPPDTAPDTGHNAKQTLAAMLAQRGPYPAITVTNAPLPLDVSRKLRRVERRFQREALD